MEELSAWVISIAGVCLISVLIDLILPDGKINTVIKNVFSFVIVLVVIMPLPKILNKNYSLENVFSEYEFQIQDQYIYNVNQAKLTKWKKDIEQELSSFGVNGVTVSISADIFELNMVVNAVYVDLYNMVISDNLKNINIKTEVVRIVKYYIDIPKEKVVFYE